MLIFIKIKKKISIYVNFSLIYVKIIKKIQIFFLIYVNFC
jgi:hypothetical protein